MKTRTVQLTAIAGIAIAAALLASPWVLAATSTASTSTASSNSSASTTSNSTGSQNYMTCQRGQGFDQGYGRSNMPGPFGRSDLQNTVNMTVGQTITITSSQGTYHEVGSPSNNGTASGTVTFTVTSKLAEGYTLSISGGSLVVGGTTYTISSGSAQTGTFAETITGQGTTTPAGQFLLQGYARGSFAGTSGTLLLDFKAGSTEYAVALSGAIQS
jgi:hypothetical protein